MKIKTTKGVLKLVRSFAKEVADFVKEGMPILTPKQYLKRLETCRTCIHYIKQTRRCGLCQCYMPIKAKMKTTVCPDKPPRWDLMHLTEEELKSEMKKSTKKWKEYKKKNKENEKK